jgi:hypothetical protein
MDTQRDWSSNTVRIRGGFGGATITIPYDAGEAATIDGFSITDGVGWWDEMYFTSTGGGIDSQSASPTISHNKIFGNDSYYGGGIYCRSGAPKITNNWIANNTAGGLYGCWGTALALTESAAQVYNNTIVDNVCWEGDPYAVYVDNDTAVAEIANNIIAANDGGIWSAGSTDPVLTNNCLYNLNSDDYQGVSQGATDIVDDPELWFVDRLHLTHTSPCLGSGAYSVVKPGDRDYRC